jgi:clan AA aspartic protease (TIGR02281 family)
VGIDERDWYKNKKDQDKVKDSWYDPKQFRQDKAGYTDFNQDPISGFKRRSSKHPPSLIKSVGIWLLIGLGFILLFQNAPFMKKVWSERQNSGLLPSHALLAGKPSCNPSTLPANGSTQISDPSRMRRTDVLFSGLEIENKHTYPVVAYLTELGTDQRVMGISIAPGSTAQASVPVGQYGLYLFAGSSWCNDQVGFADGYRVNVQGGLNIQSGGTSVLSLTSDGADAPKNFHISASHRLPQAPPPTEPTPEVKGQGFVDLNQRPDGHYYASGTVNEMPIVFMMDTGATLTSISREMAYKAGIYSCTSRTFNTANGTVQGCVTKAAKIQFGSFVLRDFELAIMPNLPNDALLGMNVLRLFHLEQQGSVMRISVR